jgi:hypothetical protein
VVDGDEPCREAPEPWLLYVHLNMACNWSGQTWLRSGGSVCVCVCGKGTL